MMNINRFIKQHSHNIFSISKFYMSAKAYYDSDFKWEEHAAQVGSLIPPFVPEQGIINKSVSLNKSSFLSWHNFHSQHMGKFFKVRNYILQAFPELQFIPNLEQLGKQDSTTNISAQNSETEPSTAIPTSSPTHYILEIGCGNGSNVFPLLETYPSYIVYGTDITPSALRSLQRHPSYSKVQDRLIPFLFDIKTGLLPTNIPGLIIPSENKDQSNTNIIDNIHSNSPASTNIFDQTNTQNNKHQSSEETTEPLINTTNNNKNNTSDKDTQTIREERRLMLNKLHESYCIIPDRIQNGNSLHAILCTFVLSAIHPQDHYQTFLSMYKLLQPNGILCFRDYGLYDLAQLRYHQQQSSSESSSESMSRLGPNWYVREGDGTFTYFFSIEEITSVVTSIGFRILNLRYATVENKNRKKGITLRRVFIHGVFQKI